MDLKRSGDTLHRYLSRHRKTGTGRTGCIKDLDSEMTQVRDKHAEDLKRERERVEVRIRETIRADIRNEIADQLTSEFASEMQKANEIH